MSKITEVPELVRLLASISQYSIKWLPKTKVYGWLFFFVTQVLGSCDYVGSEPYDSTLSLICKGFPSGSFSHSLGLESALHNGYIRKDEESLKQHLHLVFEQVIICTNSNVLKVAFLKYCLLRLSL